MGQSYVIYGAGQLLVKPKIIAFKAIILVFIVTLIISPNMEFVDTITKLIK